MKSYLGLLALSACLSTPPVVAQIFSWDPLKDVENALPTGAPPEGKIIQAREQVREMAQDAFSSLYENRARGQARYRGRLAMRCSALSA
jgi:hypothetical protein